MLLGFLTDKEPKLAVNGSTVTFKITGDIEVEAARHVIQYGKLNFVGTDRMMVNKTIEAYALGQDVFTRFQLLERLDAMYQAAEQRVRTTLPEDKQDLVMRKLSDFQVELYVMRQTLRAAAEQTEQERDAFNAKAENMAKALELYIKAPMVFQTGVTNEEIVAAQVEDAIPGAKVTSVTYVPDTDIKEAELISVGED